MWRRSSIVTVLAVAAVGPGCLFGGVKASTARKQAQAKASRERNRAAANGELELALAYDDVMLRTAEADDTRLRKDRAFHFRQLVESTTAKLGELTPATARSHFGTLVALRREARREVPTYVDERWAKVAPQLREAAGSIDAEATTRRRDDLAVIDAEVIAPRLADIATLLFAEARGLAKRGELSAAVALARAVQAELPTDGPDASVANTIAQQAAAVHLGLARSVGDSLPGARVLHAKIAALFTSTASVGALAEPGPALTAKIDQNWTVTSAGDCGNTGNQDETVSLVDALRGEGFGPGPGSPLALDVSYDGCPITSREWDTSEEVPFREKQKIMVEVPDYQERCTPGTETVDKLEYPDETITFTRRSAGSCSRVQVGTYQQEREVWVDGMEQVTVHHRTHTMAARGTIRIKSDLGPHERTFSLTVTSSDDTAWTSVHGGTVRLSGHTESEARRRMHDLVRGEIQTLAKDVLSARASVELTRAKTAIAAGDTRTVDDALFTAYGITRAVAPVPPELESWATATYKLAPAELSAALAGKSLPTLDLATGHELKLPAVQITLRDDVESVYSEALTSRTLRNQAMLTLTAGPAATALAGTATTSYAGIASFGVVVVKKAGRSIGFRMHGGVDQHLTGIVDADFLAGYGVHLGGLTLSLHGGVGGDFTPGGERDATSPLSLYVPPGVYAEYGGRLHYAFRDALSFEGIYTKAFRTSTDLAAETRADVRIALVLPGGFPAALTFRHAEYLPDVSGLFTGFSASGRLASTNWLLIGVGL